MTDAKGLSLTPVDGRTVRLHKPTEYREEVKGSDIIRLYQDNGPLEIKVGTSITYGKTKHKVNVIKRGMNSDKIVCYDLKNSLLTSSSIFALPFLGANKKYMLWDSLFVNAFISTEEYDECIALLYRFSGETLFTKFEAAMCAMPNFIKFEDVDKYHVLFIFDVPDSAKNSYQRFRNGEYSQIDDIWKLMILDYHGFDSNGKTGQILYKNPELKKSMEKRLFIELPDGAELHDIPDMKYEKFNKEYYQI
jgi:hypothetical protein|tara:strand:- start:150 stop:896 length:747 start_codon:yes stop_codon:yes gene_type:complete